MLYTGACRNDRAYADSERVEIFKLHKNGRALNIVYERGVRVSEAIIGIDIGTSGCRAVITDINLNIKRVVSADYKTYYPKADMAVQDPDEIVAAVFQCLRDGLHDENSVMGIVVGSCFHTLLLTDNRIVPMDRLIPWLDTRATTQARRLFAESVHTYKTTACPPSSSYPLSKLVWYKESQPDILRKAGKVIGIKEYVLYKLTGELVVDQCVASGTGLFDIHNLKWDANSMALSGITNKQMADVVPCVEQLSLTKQAGSVIGIPPGTPVIAGGGDGLMASLGVGAIQHNDLAVMIGTSAACRKLVDKPFIDKTGLCRTWCYYFTDNIWAVGTSVNNGGIVYKWFVEHLCGDLYNSKDNGGNKMQLLLEKLDGLSSKGIVFLPFIRPEREPFWDPEMAAEYIGIRNEHTLADLLQSTLQGVNNLVFTMVDMVDEVAGPINRILATGGFTKLEPWVKDLASLFRRSLYLPENQEAAAYGACILGLSALGHLDSLKEVKSGKSKKVEPDYSYVDIRNKEYDSFIKHLKAKSK